MAPRSFVLLLAFLLSACASTAHYACGLPDGVTCKPVSAVYAASLGGGSRATGGDSHGSAGKADAIATPFKEGANTKPTTVVATIKPGDPLLLPPKQIRVWINRWEDQAGDLHDETYLYLRLDNGRWRLPP